MHNRNQLLLASIFISLWWNSTCVLAAPNLANTSDVAGNVLTIAKIASKAIVITIPTAGDANCDTKINVLDLVAIANQILGLATAACDADANSDGKVNSLDLVAVANQILTL